MLTKQNVEELKTNGNGDIQNILQPSQESTVLTYILNNLGRLPSNFDGHCFLPLTQHKQTKIRLLAVKNIGKLSDVNFLKNMLSIAENDESTEVKREAVSSIGRMRNKKTIPYLIKILKNNDPKIVLQAIRALLVFKSNNNVREALTSLMHHPNELIQSVIEKEFAKSEKIDIKKPKHFESPDYLKNTVVNGDVLEILKNIPDESIHLTFTSPPYYNARDYSIYQSYKQYLEFLRDVFKEVHRVTKEGRFFILNTSPIIIPRVSRQHSSKRYSIPFDIHPYLMEMGWEFIDDIIWVKPEASAKNRNAGFLQHRKPLGYKANATTEYIMVYRKNTHKLLDWNIRQYDYQTVNKSKVLGKYETSNVWRIDPTFDKTHSAVFPIELCNRIIKFYSYEGDLVFDPFAGSGTLGKSALNLSRNYFLTEIAKDYFDRIKENLNTSNMFNQHLNQKFISSTEFSKYMKEKK